MNDVSATYQGNFTSQCRNIPANNNSRASVVKDSPLSRNAPAIAGRTANASGMLCHVDDSGAVGSNTSSVFALSIPRASSRLMSDSIEPRLGSSMAGAFPDALLFRTDLPGVEG